MARLASLIFIFVAAGFAPIAAAQKPRAGATLSGLAAIREIIDATVALDVNGSIRTLKFTETGVSVRRGSPLFDSFPGVWRHDARSEIGRAHV